MRSNSICSAGRPSKRRRPWPNSTGTVVTAMCPAGSKAVGGGWSAGIYGYQLSEGPTPDGLGWTATFETFESPASVTVSAMCIAA